MKQQNSWDLEGIYPNMEAFDKEYSLSEENMKVLASYEGKLQDRDVLLDFFRKSEESEMLLSKLFCYASMCYDRNQKDPLGQTLRGRVMDLFSRYIQATSFSSSQIKALGKETLLKLSKEKDFAPYSYSLRGIVHNEEHIKSDIEEKIMANFAPVSNNFADLYDMLAVADSTDKVVTFSTGESMPVTHSNYGSLLEGLKSQEDRKIAFEGLYQRYHDLRNTYAGIYNGIVLSNVADMKNRGHSSILTTFLDHNAIPESVYLSLLSTVHKNAHLVHEYYELKRQALKLDTFHTYDRMQTVATSDKTYTYEEAKELFFKAAEKIGGDFVTKAHQVLEEGRVDVYPQEGKRTGAYSTGYYDLGPYILLNFDGRFNDIFTVAHEAGHSIHTMLANENNTFFNSNYTIFVAEIASTFNEQVLQDYFMEQKLDHNTKLYLLQSACDDLIATFYRQTLFADFEYQAHNLALNNQPITASSLEAIMTKLYKEYYNIDLDTEPLKKEIWAYIPHLFHSPFYVYQYATCLACSMAIYDKVKNKEPHALENYFAMLKAGGSDFPMEIVKIGGVDLTTPEPFEAVFKRFAYLVEEFKKELAK